MNDDLEPNPHMCEQNTPDNTDYGKPPPEVDDWEDC